MAIVFNGKRVADVKVGGGPFAARVVSGGAEIWRREEPRFFCYGNKRVYLSRDGLSWRCVMFKKSGSSTIPTWVQEPAFGNGIWLSGGGSALYRSTNGFSWSREGTGYAYHPIFADGRFVVAKEGDARIAESADGKSWAFHYPDPSSLGVFVAVAYNPTLKLFTFADYYYLKGGSVLDGGYLYYAATLGATPTKATNTARKYTSVTAGGGKFVATATGSKIVYTTADGKGKSWASSDSIASNWDFSMYGDAFYAHCPEGLYRSTDGKTWTRRANAPAGMLSLAWRDGVLVANTGGDEGGIWRSADSGASWAKVMDAPNVFTKIQTIGVKA